MADQPFVALVRYCLCGAGIRVTARPSTADDLIDRFVQFHSGDGHGPATARQAGSARLRDEAKRFGGFGE